MLELKQFRNTLIASHHALPVEFLIELANFLVRCLGSFQIVLKQKKREILFVAIFEALGW